MKADFKVDASKLLNALEHVRIGADDLMQMGMAGSAPVKAFQIMKVAKDTRATELSISDHIVTSQRDIFVDEIGPETEYAPNIEYGRRDMPNYPIQPFVVPSAHGNSYNECLHAISVAFGLHLVSKWK